MGAAQNQQVSDEEIQRLCQVPASVCVDGPRIYNPRTERPYRVAESSNPDGYTDASAVLCRQICVNVQTMHQINDIRDSLTQHATGHSTAQVEAALAADSVAGACQHQSLQLPAHSSTRPPRHSTQRRLVRRAVCLLCQHQGCQLVTPRALALLCHAMCAHIRRVCERTKQIAAYERAHSVTRSCDAVRAVSRALVDCGQNGVRALVCEWSRRVAGTHRQLRAQLHTVCERRARQEGGQDEAEEVGASGGQAACLSGRLYESGAVTDVALFQAMDTSL